MMAVPDGDEILRSTEGMSAGSKWRKRRKNKEKRPRNQDPECQQGHLNDYGYIMEMLEVHI